MLAAFLTIIMPPSDALSFIRSASGAAWFPVPCAGSLESTAALSLGPDVGSLRFDVDLGAAAPSSGGLMLLSGAASGMETLCRTCSKSSWVVIVKALRRRPSRDVPLAALGPPSAGRGDRLGWLGEGGGGVAVCWAAMVGFTGAGIFRRGDCGVGADLGDADVGGPRAPPTRLPATRVVVLRIDRSDTAEAAPSSGSEPSEPVESATLPALLSAGAVGGRPVSSCTRFAGNVPLAPPHSPVHQPLPGASWLSTVIDAPASKGRSPSSSRSYEKSAVAVALAVAVAVLDAPGARSIGGSRGPRPALAAPARMRVGEGRLRLGACLGEGLPGRGACHVFLTHFY